MTAIEIITKCPKCEHNLKYTRTDEMRLYLVDIYWCEECAEFWENWMIQKSDDTR